MNDVLNIILNLADNYYCFIVCKEWQKIMLTSSYVCKKCHKIVKMYDTILWYSNKKNNLCHEYYDKIYTLPSYDKHIFFRDNFQHIRQCKALCIDVIKDDYRNLRYIIKPYRVKEIFLVATECNPLSIQYLDKTELTKELMINALRKNGMVLRFIPKERQLQEIITTALKQNGLALQYVMVPITDIMIYTAIKQNGLSLEFIPEEFRMKFIIKALKTNGNTIKLIPPEQRTKELCVRALQSNIEAASYIPEEHHKIFKSVVGHSRKLYLYYHYKIEFR